MAFTPAQMREYRRTLKGRGVCTRCMVADAEPGFVCCPKCRKDLNASRRAYRYQWDRDPMRCAKCGAWHVEPRPPTAACYVCNEKRRRVDLLRRGIRG